MIKIKVDIPKIKLRKLTAREIDQAADILLKDLRDTVPYDTGQLFRGIRKRRTSSGVELYIQGRRNNEVAGYLIQGTKAHMVRPRRAKALHWIQGGMDRFSMGHRVRGIRKGTWRFNIRARALQRFANMIIKFTKQNLLRVDVRRSGF